MKNIKQTFKVYCSTNINDKVTKNLVYDLTENNEPLILEAIASTTSQDLDGDYMTHDCLQDMKKQAKGLSIFLDHNHTIDKIVGKVTEVVESSSDIFKIKFSVLPKYEWYITDLLENGINLGLSIGASVLDFEDTDTGWKINKVKLVEISIVGIPANWDTFGTVQTSKELGEVTAKCFNGACKQIIDNLDLQKSLINKDIEDGKDPDEEECITEEDVIKLINQAMIELKNQIITEIVAEYDLDGKKYAPVDDDEATEPTNSSTTDDSEDKEKDLEMEENEIIELIKEHSLSEEVVKGLVIDALKEFKEAEATTTEETPIIEEEEVEVVKEETVEIEKEVEPTIEEVVEEETIEKSTEITEEEEIVDVEKSTEQVIDVETLKKSIKEELKAEVREEVESELLKELSTERKPVAKEQPKMEEVEKEATEEEIIEKKGNVMSARKMAEHLLK